MLIFGAKNEREFASGREKWLTPPGSSITTFKGSQTTNSFFALHQFNIGQWSFSAGGRVDSVSGQSTFPTWRVTAAYRLAATGTKFRISAGTGAKAPTLFQRFSQFGSTNLQAETNVSYEIGIDQSLWQDRAKFSVTLFQAQYRNLIGFNPVLNGGIGGYFNVGKATIQGVEAAATVILVPAAWKIRAAYTYLLAYNATTKLSLLRRPKHKGYLSVTYSGIPRFVAEGRVTFVGSRADISNDFPFSRIKLAGFGKFDARVSYKLSDNISLFARVENITNARYQEIRDYGVAGRSFYGGVKIVW